MKLPLYQVDAFTARPFKGNPAAVCFLDAPRPDEWMLALAQEMNLSETAFLLAENDGYNLRWFTPALEVDLCGHATLASAHILFETGRLEPGATARFHSRSGLLTAVQASGWVELNVPSSPAAPAVAPPGMLEALGLQDTPPVYTGKASDNAYLLELESEAEVRRLRPDFSRLYAVQSARGVIVTSQAQTAGYDFVSRFFAPRMGINEDPVTGAAHTHLTPYWAGRLGRSTFSAYQASPRGGDLRLRLDGDRVGIAGQAVTVFSTEISVS